MDLSFLMKVTLLKIVERWLINAVFENLNSMFENLIRAHLLLRPDPSSSILQFSGCIEMPQVERECLFDITDCFFKVPFFIVSVTNEGCSAKELSMKVNIFLKIHSCAESATPVSHLDLRVENKAFCMPNISQIGLANLEKTRHEKYRLIYI